MFAFVRIRLPDGTERRVSPSDLVGRLETAALHLDDARISEAHALVSLRG
jgi:pSer/pThr/pTyr-binding forkhead associated (FHA) protein